jgi:dipeptidyl aminopeptidase/acylaminoacyl peptidase
MTSIVLRGALAAMLAVAAGPSVGAEEKTAATDVASRFGAREMIIDISLSPDGSHIAYVVPAAGKGTRVLVSKADGSEMKPVAGANGDPLNLTDCGWSSSTRLACREYGVSKINEIWVPFTRIVAISADGTKALPLGRKTMDATRISQFDGRVIDWLAGTDGNVLMVRDYVPGEGTTGSRVAEGQADGLGVDQVDTVTGRGKTIERPVVNASDYFSDGQGAIRIVAADEAVQGGTLTGITTYRYRLNNDRSWRLFSRIGPDGAGLRPVAVDGTTNQAYAVQSHDGRDAVYRVALDGSLRSDLVYAHPTVDVRGVVTIGRRGKVIGASYVTDRRQVEYFDPEYRKLAQSLAKALPNLPLIYFISASADEKKLIVFAGSDVDPGAYYLLDRTTKKMDLVQIARPELSELTLARVTSVAYPAGDGTNVPAYLTLPPTGAGKNLPAIVMPHGGPASRDEWGFDWLAQFFAQRGYAVLQPQFRGSAGYGDAWYAENGFKSWKTAIGDITDGARWMTRQGIADPARLAIVGWSYGGYAALQAQVVDPKLFKAVVSIAPVTSLALMKKDAQDYTNSRMVSRFVGDGPHIVEGSPLKHPDAFQAPVLMFHGDRDINVDIGHSQAMDKALRKAGKASRLVVYKGLDHQLDDGMVRADMLTQTDQFLRTVMAPAATAPGAP